MMRPLAAALLVAAFAPACSPQPCTACATVAGTYDEQGNTNTLNCGDATLELGGGGGAFGITQSGSEVTLVFSNQSLKGVLHEDLSASFGPQSVNITQYEDGDETTPIGTIPGTLYLDGWFNVSDGVATSFSGSWSVVSTNDHCEVSSNADWIRSLSNYL